MSSPPSRSPYDTRFVSYSTPVDRRPNPRPEQDILLSLFTPTIQRGSGDGLEWYLYSTPLKVNSGPVSAGLSESRPSSTRERQGPVVLFPFPTYSEPLTETKRSPGTPLVPGKV